MTTPRMLVMSALLSASSTFGATALAAVPDVEGPTAVVATAPPSQAGIATDSNIDRGILLPTAMTQPQGSATYNNYELLLHGLTYGFNDHLQGTVTVISPVVKDMPFYGVASMKWRAIDSGPFHFAVQGSAGLVHVFTDTNNPTVYTLGTGAFASFCLRADCSSLLSASATFQHFFASEKDANVLIYGASLVHGVSQHVKLLGEVTSVAGSTSTANDSDSFGQYHGAVASYGVRLHTDNLAGDIGFIRPIGSDSGDFLLGLPFISVSYRWR